MSDFAHLHLHTDYSFLDGMIKPKAAAETAKTFGMPAVAITDHGNMCGAIDFYKACKEAEVKPILGCEVYVCNDRFTGKNDANETCHLILLAQNAEGYHNLMKISDKSHLEGFNRKPRCDHDLLKQHSSGLVCSSACLAGEIPRAILSGDLDKARAIAIEYAAMFPGRYFLEIQHNGIEKQDSVNAAICQLSQDLKIPIVATNDCHYLARNDYEAHEALVCVGRKGNDGKVVRLDDIDRDSYDPQAQLYFKSAEEMRRAFADTPEACDNTLRIAEMCDVELELGKPHFPIFPLPAGTSVADEFRRQAEDGLEKRLAENASLDADIYRSRLQRELSVIIEMGFPGYFLTVQEFINWAKNNDIAVGPGRGSAAGSLVSWALRITELDPIPYGLLFERFLNPERVSLPDIDVDFDNSRRDDVIQHLRDIYGADRVAQLSTTQNLKARQSLKDAAGVLGLYAEKETISKLVADGKAQLSEALEKYPELAEKKKAMPRLFAIAEKFEGVKRHSGKHASGVVVSDDPLIEYTPLMRKSKDDVPVTQYDGAAAESVGLVKFDILGVKALTTIETCLAFIRQSGKEAPDMNALAPYDDMETYKIFTTGKTEGVFQIEGDGMTKYLISLAPTCFEDLIAMLALYRPGPLGSGMVDSFIRRKHGGEEVSYYGLDEILEPILSPTYGVIVYQEQVMQVAQAMAGYTLGGADLLRRAMGKKKPEEMAKQHSVFVEGCLKNGIGREKADEVFGLMEKFAEYGFNKSHSAAYAVITYQMAYLKAHFPIEFFAAVMSTCESAKLQKYLDACRKAGISVRPPNVNRSGANFTVVNGEIFFGIGNIADVGGEKGATLRNIVAARSEKPFSSLRDLYWRVPRITAKAVRGLVKAGACDSFGVSRAAMIAVLPEKANKTSFDLVATKAASKTKKGAATLPAQTETGIGFDVPEAEIQEFPAHKLMQLELEACGNYISGHPLDAALDEIYRQGWKTIGQYGLENADCATVAAIITSAKEHVCKNGKKMAFLKISDLTGTADLTVFTDDWKAHKAALQPSSRPLIFDVRLNTWNGGQRREEPEDEWEEEGDGEEKVKEKAKPVVRMIFRRLRMFDQAATTSTAPVIVFVPDNASKEQVSQLAHLLNEHQGQARVQFYQKSGDICNLLPQNIFVQPSLDFYHALHAWQQSVA